MIFPDNEPRLRDFELCRLMLEMIGAEYHQATEWVTENGERFERPLPKFRSVKLPLTAEEWVSLTQRENDHYIGGCCGNSSQTQDRVNALYRFESGWVSGDKLEEIAREVVDHDGEESEFWNYEVLSEKVQNPEAGKPRDPWVVMAAVFHLTRFHLSSGEAPRALGEHVPPIRKALSILEHIATAISWEHIFDRGREITVQDKATRAVALARFAPALAFVQEHLDQLYYGPVTGTAIIDLESGPNGIASNGYGLCIYDTSEDVEAILSRTIENIPEARARLSTRPVRVSKEEGIVFLDTGEKYEFVHKETPRVEEGDDE